MREFSVLTYNTGLCRFFGVSLCCEPFQRARLIRDALKRLNPDIICFQEMWDAQLTAEVLSELPEHQVLPGEQPAWRTPIGSGLLLASRWPMVRSSFQKICTTYRPKEILASRGLLTATIELDGQPLTITNTHLGIGPTWARRRQHLAMLRALHCVNPHVLCGDFNVTIEEMTKLRFATKKELAEYGFRDALAEVHGERQAANMVTVDRANPLITTGHHKRLDYIWIRPQDTKQFQVLDAQVIFNEPINDLYLSDHYAVWARVAIA